MVHLQRTLVILASGRRSCSKGALLATGLLLAVSACTSKEPAPKTETRAAADRESVASPTELSTFWTSADRTIHEVQSALRDARLVAHELGGDAAKGDYAQVIALGHLFGGLGHDHVTPGEKRPVLALLDAMDANIEALTRIAATPAELDAARKATPESAATLTPRAQRLYHLLRARDKVASVRSRATALGFQSNS